MKITWITDGLGWGHDHQVREISKRLPEYDHSFIFRKRGPNLGGNKWLLEIYELFVERIRKTKPDVVMSMHWLATDKSMLNISVCRICGNRAMQGVKANGNRMADRRP